jgi:hypothetical protein
MLDLGTISTIIGAIAWLHSFGKEDVKQVKEETEELISDLSKSTLSNTQFVEAFQDVQNYADKFYFDDASIRAAHTRCGNVGRDVDRIKFKLVKFLRTDLGKWNEADQQLNQIIFADNSILYEYQNNLDRLKGSMSLVSELIKKGEVDEARKACIVLGRTLQDDLTSLRDGVEQMRVALDYVRQVVN